jgi:muramoyltetrapeptide carboxypeptidase LdcA involved in peptidoglycan recycling
MKNRVRIIAPASMYLENSLEKLATMKGFLESHGFIVSVQEEIFADPPIPFCANTKEKRLKGLRDAILSPDVDILWAFRGGYGSGEIVEDCMDIRPVGDKILIGFSDITILHRLFNHHYKIPSIHGNMIGGLADNPEKTQEIIDILKGHKKTITLIPQNEEAKIGKMISGTLSGGNLTVLGALCGTKLPSDMTGSIMVIEDIAEPGYKVARELNQLEKSGIFNGVVACIFGDFYKCTQDFEAIQYFINTHPELPIYRTLDGIGHGPQNHPLVFGASATISGDILECSPII